MKKPDFLSKIKKQRKIELVEPSDEISESYSLKSDNSLKSAKVLLNENLYENSISMSYYAMYNSLISLLFKAGIKSENHTASIILLKKLFGLDDLNKIIFEAKKERVDKQYYITNEEIKEVDEETSKKMIEDAEKIILEINAYKIRLDEEKINELRKKFLNIF